MAAMERCSRSDLLNVIDGLQGEVKLYKAKLHGELADHCYIVGLNFAGYL